MINPFDELKSRLTIQEVAERYGVRILHGNKALCCFHDEKTPSLSFKGNTFFKCFSCEAKGSAVDFVMQMFNLSPLESAKKLSEDFNLRLFEENLTPQRKKEIQAETKKQEEYKKIIRTLEIWSEKTEKWFLRVFKKFQEVIGILPKKQIEGGLSQIHILALHNLGQVENALDILQAGDDFIKAKNYKNIENYKRKLTEEILKEWSK